MEKKLKKEIRIVGGVAKIVETENGKIIRIIEDYKEYTKRNKESKPIIHKSITKNDSLDKTSIVDNIVDIVKSSSPYREPYKSEGKYIRFNLGKIPGIKNIMSKDIEKRKFLVICYKKDKNLSVPTIQISGLEKNIQDEHATYEERPQNEVAEI